MRLPEAVTEEQWLGSGDPLGMYWHVVLPLESSERRMDLFCLACAHSVLHLIEDEGARRPFAWLEEHPGERPQRLPGGHVRRLFEGPALGLYEARHRREAGVSGRAVHVAYDFWADWYEYAFDNLYQLAREYPGALHDEPRTYLRTVLRELFGNPFRPVTLHSPWRTATVAQLAEAACDDRPSGGHLDPARLAVLSGALEEAGCDSPEILEHLRSPGPHLHGCWALDLVTDRA